MSDAWPFLVTRNRVRDYQPLVAPGFLIDKDSTGQLIGLPVGGSDGEGTRREAHLDRTPAGQIAVVYRAVEAKLNGEVLHDMAGRQVLRIEGVVLRDRNSVASVSEDILDKAHQAVELDFQSFWNTTERAQTRPSAPIPLPRGPEKPLPLDRARIALGASLVGSLMLLGLYHIAFGPDEDTIAKLSASVEEIKTDVAARAHATAVEALRGELAAAKKALAADNKELAAKIEELQARISALHGPNK